MGALMLLLEFKFFRIDFCIDTSKLTTIICCKQVIYKSLCRMKMSRFDFFVWNKFFHELIFIKIPKMISQNVTGSMSIGIPMSCVSAIFPTVKNQFSIKFLSVVFNELQVNTIQPFKKKPKNFSFSANVNVLLPPWKKNLLVEKLYQKASCVVILYECTEVRGRYTYITHTFFVSFILLNRFSVL